MADIVTVLTKRLGDAKQAATLAAAYDKGLIGWAQTRTAGTGPVPTTLSAERVELLLAISVAGTKLLTEREIAALMRLTPAAARRLSVELIAMHEDTIQPFIYTYAFMDAVKVGVGGYGSVKKGTIVSFATEAQMDALITEARRTGVSVSRKRDDAERPWLVYIADTLDVSHYGVK